MQLPCADDSDALPLAQRKRKKRPPLVLFGGTAQTINGWVGHHKPLAEGRTLLQYDLRGQGRMTSLSIADCSLRRHVADFEELVLNRLNLPTPVDLVSRLNPKVDRVSSRMAVVWFVEKSKHDWR